MDEVIDLTVKMKGDTGPLEAAFNQVNAKLGRSAQGMSHDLDGLGRSARNSGYGFMLLGQMVDDAQYGFKSIVNNIPGVAMAMGASMKLSGALGLGAVAVNLWINNWDDLKDIVSDTGPFKAAESAVKSLSSAMKEHLGISFSTSSGRGAAEARSEAERKAAGGGGVASLEGAGRGADFRAALERAGGEEKVVEEIYKFGAEAGEKTAKDISDYRTKAYGRIKMRIARSISAGDETTIGLLTGASPKLAEAYRAAQEEGERKRNEPNIKIGQELLAEKERLAQEEARSIEQNNREIDMAREKQAESMSRAAEAGPIGRQLLLSPGMNITRTLSEHLAKAGLEFGGEAGWDIAQRTEKKLRERMAEAVSERSLEKGITPEAARIQLLQEGIRKGAEAATRENGGPFRSVFGSAEDLQKQFQGEILSGKGDVQKDQLEELKKAVAALGKVDEQTDRVARAVEGGIVARASARR